MNIYKFDEKTKEYIGSAPVLLDPLETAMQKKDVFLIPANATTAKPPAKKEGYARIWDGSKWEHIEDHRGQKYWLESDKYGTPAREMQTIGKLPDNAILTAPVMTLEEVKEKKIAELKAERDALEVEYITVNGNTFDYDDKARERINNAIIALQASGASINWTTADHKSVPVTASDLVEVVARVAERSNALHVAYRTAKQTVIDAETVEDVQAVRLEVVGDTEANHA